MALAAKVSLATALPTVRALVSDLGRAIKDVGPLAGVDAVTSAAATLDAYAGDKGIDAEVVVVTPLLVAEAGKVGLWMGSGFPVGSLAVVDQRVAATLAIGATGGILRVTVRPLADVGASVAGKPRPPVLVAIVGNVAALDPERLSALEGLLEDRPRAVIVAPSTHPTVTGLVERGKALAWSLEVVDPASPPPTTLPASFADAPWDSSHDLLRAQASAVGLDSLVNVFGLVLDQQVRDLRVKRSVAQGKLGPPAKPGAPAVPRVLGSGGGPGAELIAEIKTRIQRHSQEFEKGASERLADFANPASGSLARETEAMLAAMDKLQEEERSTKIETRVPPAFEARLTKTVRERIARQCTGDVVAINDLFRLLSQEIERVLQAAGGPPYVPSFVFLTEDRVRRLLDMSAVFQYQYRGELPKRGFNEYFASVRKYSMLLVMAASMFGAAQMIRAYREYFLPVTLLLVIWGIYSVTTSTHEQRIESLEKELDAARNAIRPDLKRIFSEVQKNWGSTLQQHLDDQVAACLADLDAAIKDHQARKGAETSPEKERLQRQVAQLEAAEKKLALPAKARETLAASVSQVRADLRTLLPKPGVPGAKMAVAAAGGGLQDAKSKLAALKAQTPGAGAEPEGAPAQSALEVAKAKMAALKAQSAAPKPAGDAAPSPFEAAKAKMAALKAQSAANKAAVPARPPAAPKPEAAAPPAPVAEKPAAASPFDAARAKMVALKAQAAARRTGAKPEGEATPAAAGAAPPKAAPAPAPPPPVGAAPTAPAPALVPAPPAPAVAAVAPAVVAASAAASAAAVALPTEPAPSMVSAVAPTAPEATAPDPAPPTPAPVAAAPAAPEPAAPDPPAARPAAAPVSAEAAAENLPAPAEGEPEAAPQ